MRGTCDRCDQTFEYRLIHSGFNDTAFAYCDSCGGVAFLSIYSRKPPGVVLDFGTIAPEVEPFLAPCDCGGRFRADAAPRCPNCHQPLSAERATAYIEANAPGTAKGWRWQRAWHGLYALVVENRSVENPWDSTTL